MVTVWGNAGVTERWPLPLYLVSWATNERGQKLEWLGYQMIKKFSDRLFIAV